MPTVDIERGLVARYLYRVLKQGNIPLRAARYILYWLNDRTEMLSLPLPGKLSTAVGNIYSSNFSQSDFNEAYKAHGAEVLKMLKDVAEETGWPQPLNKNILHLIKALALPRSSEEILMLITCFHRYEQVQYLCNSVTESVGSTPRSLSLLTNLNLNEIEKLVNSNGDLVSCGLVQIKSDGNEISGSGGRYQISSRVDDCLDQRFKNFKAMREVLLGSPLEAYIELDDYRHVSEDRDLICEVLSGAVREGGEGLNILLYGPPGSGKTELTKVAANAAGLNIYSAGEDVGSEGEADRKARLSDLVFSLGLLSESKDAAILFDEMEDVALHLIRRGGSKLYLNRLLETNKIPILWTSNNISDIDPALLRRMSLAIELKSPPTAQRQRIISRMAKRMGVTLTEDEVKHLAHTLEATPAILENAMKVAKYSDGGARAIERAAIGINRAVSGVQARKVQALSNYDPRLSSASQNIADLVDLLKRSGKLNFSLCLSGPPGTGKSAYARHLAAVLGLEVIQKRASDIFSAFVGETEKRIADAFDEARDNKAFLIFDEADSLLFSREEAVRSWEVSQVNEMLTWMEEHPYPICFTTNQMGRMDSASLRRFTFHIQFHMMDRDDLRQGYKLFFGFEDLPDSALAFDNLTPGDFAQVRKQAEVLGVVDDLAQIVSLLREVSRGKPDFAENIGFMN